METKNIDAVKVTLKNEAEQMRTKMDSLRDEMALLEIGLSRVEAALVALDGPPAAAVKAKDPKVKPRQKMQLPAPKRKDVVEVMRGILSQREVLDAEKLKGLIEMELVSRGCARSGLAMRFKEALSEPEFVDTPGGIRLAEKMAASV